MVIIPVPVLLYIGLRMFARHRELVTTIGRARQPVAYNISGGLRFLESCRHSCFQLLSAWEKAELAFPVLRL